MAAAMAKLPPNQRLALILCYGEECSYAETAAELGLSVKAVGSLLVRVKQRQLGSGNKIVPGNGVGREPRGSLLLASLASLTDSPVSAPISLLWRCSLHPDQDHAQLESARTSLLSA
jgi:hypothetical protein